MTIHRQQKGYTCGPGSLRNMVRVMHKVKHGDYDAPAEDTLANWLGTSSNGTAIGAIRNVLNNHFGKYGSWDLRNQDDKFKYLGYVVVDTRDYKQPLIQGVQAKELPYYHGWKLNHFNWLYGYDTRTDQLRVFMGDGFDPVYLYGTHWGYGNPYGRHEVALSHAFHANDVSCAACSDRRRLIV